jgi:hypothetical protein
MSHPGYPGYEAHWRAKDCADGWSNPDIAVFEFQIANEAYPRAVFYADGSMGFGSGAAAAARGGFSTIAADLTMATATLAASGLSVPASASTRYYLEAQLEVVTPEADDFQFQVNVPSGGSGRGVAMGLAVGSTAITGDVSLGAWVAGTPNTLGSEDTGPVFVNLTGIVIIGDTAGAVTISVAKGADAGADGTLEANGSLLKLTPVAGA